MTARLGFLLLLLSVAPACAGVISNIPDGSQTVLPRSANWAPTVQQRREALTAIQRELEKTKPSDQSFQASELREILASKAGYRVQFLVVERNGGHVLVCNFLPRVPDRLEPKNWHTDEVAITDGGSSYWSAEYDTGSHAVRVYEIGNG